LGAAPPPPAQWKRGQLPFPLELVNAGWLHPAQFDGNPSPVKLVDRPADACLFLLDPGSLSEGKSEVACGDFKWKDLPHWSAAGGPGRNHILIMPGCLKLCDAVGEFSCYGSIGQAMVASSATWRGNFRPGYDLALPQVHSAAVERFFRRSVEKGPLRAKEGSHQRPLLVSFRGTTAGTDNRWNRHRAIAALYAHNPSKGAIIEVKRKRDMRRQQRRLRSKQKRDPCEEYAFEVSEDAWSYDDLLLNSSFGFSPGGGGPYSFRFFEILASGGVPVVSDDLVLPFEGLPWKESYRSSWGDVWDSCVVRVSDAELFALPEVLVAIARPGSAAFDLRRRACGDIWSKAVLGASNGSFPVEKGPMPGPLLGYTTHLRLWSGLREKLSLWNFRYQHSANR
jgi:hypothetical protein